MEKIIHSLISNWIKGVDTYTHNGSTWLIFTDSRKWVVELTESKTLWYNYNFFKQIFEFTSLDVVENQQYITKWVEDNVINKVKHTVTANNHIFDRVEDAIQNGVKVTITSERYRSRLTAENIIENGVKRTQDNPFSMITNVENTIQNGVKETIELMNELPNRVKKIIKKGVKETNHVDVMKFFDNKMEDAIQNGVKETQFNDNENKSWVEGVIKGGVKHTEIGWHQCNNIDDAIENGVKEIFDTEFMPQAIVNDIIQNGVKETSLKRGTRPFMVNETLKNGVKETKTPGKDGDILSTIEWMNENKSNSYTKMIDDVIDNGEKINGTYVGGNRQKENIESVIGYGTKNPTD
jgi:predicted peroxiredoxin